MFVVFCVRTSVRHEQNEKYVLPTGCPAWHKRQCKNMSSRLVSQQQDKQNNEKCVPLLANLYIQCTQMICETLCMDCKMQRWASPGLQTFLKSDPPVPITCGVMLRCLATRLEKTCAAAYYWKQNAYEQRTHPNKQRIWTTKNMRIKITTYKHETRTKQTNC